MELSKFPEFQKAMFLIIVFKTLRSEGYTMQVHESISKMFMKERTKAKKDSPHVMRREENEFHKYYYTQYSRDLAILFRMYI